MKNEDQLKPPVSFIGIGTGKAATTWISACLAEHPEICMSSPKEVSFFIAKNYTQGMGWYASHFVARGNKKIVGEYSPAYFAQEDVPERIHHDYPNAKLIISLRNPKERFVSSRQFKVAMGRHADATIDETALETHKEELDEGLYAKHLKNYLRFFPKEQMIIIFYEDIQKDPLSVIQKIYAFLGADSSFMPTSLKQKVNVTGINTTKFPIVHRTTGSLYKKFTRSVYHKRLLPLLKEFGVDKLFHFIRKANLRDAKNVLPMKRDLLPVVEKKLSAYFKDDIAELETLTGRDLSSWK